jgi:hypothetical protein
MGTFSQKGASHMDANELVRKARFYAEGGFDSYEDAKVFLTAALVEPTWRREMADDLGHIMGSVERWARGEAAPHECLIHGVGAWILAKLEEESTSARQA